MIHRPVAYEDELIRESAADAAESLRAIAKRWRRRVRAGARHDPDEIARWLRGLETAAREIEAGPDSPTRVAEQQRAEATLEPFRLLVDTVTEYAIFMLDAGGHIVSWNPGAERIKGYSAEEILGKHFSIFYTRGDVDVGKPTHELEIATRSGRYTEEGWRVRKNGDLFWASVVITALRDPVTGVLRGFGKVTRDLTERRTADELLRRSEERLRLLVESVKDYAIFMLDVEGRVATWNSGAESIIGYRAEEILGRHLSVFYPAEDAAAGRPAREIATATEEGRYEEEGWRVRKTGERFWASVVLTAVHDPITGTLRGFAKVTQDLTERRRVETEARQAAERAAVERARAAEAQNALALRDEFLSIAAHELRTPLQALELRVQSAASLLRRLEEDGDGAPEKAAQRIEAAALQVDRLRDLVERLLDVSRIARGGVELVPEEVDLVGMVQRVVDDLRLTARNAGSELRISGDPHVVGHWDPARLEQVLVNLLSNAIKYGNGRPVEVDVRQTDSRVHLRVRDEGIGIAEADLARIFSRFERAVSLRHFGGLGLGLYITRNLVEAHGGTIRVASRPGEGTTFEVELPRRTPPHADPRPESPA